MPAFAAAPSTVPARRRLEACFFRSAVQPLAGTHILSLSAEHERREVRMARVGETIEHPLTGERLTFLETAATTGGDLLKISIDMAPGGTLARPHVHPRSVEEFEILRGRIQIKTDGKTRVADVGESVIVPRGAAHVWGNPFDDLATVTVAVRPALKMETMFETVFSLASDGKLNPKTQMPSFLQLMLTAHAYREEIVMPGVAGMALRGLSSVLTPLARARGYRSRYPQYSDSDSP
jgi:quercetin dioxygenase-like cupin family protein